MYSKAIQCDAVLEITGKSKYSPRANLRSSGQPPGLPIAMREGCGVHVFASRNRTLKMSISVS